MPYRKIIAVIAAASTLTTAGVIDATVATAQPAPYNVTVSTSKTSVVIDQAIKVSGSVSPSYKGQTVELLRKTSKGYKNVSKHTVVMGKYAFKLRPTAPGTFSYRIYAGKHGTRPAGHSEAFGVQVYEWHYLADLDHIGYYGWDTGSIEVNGKTYAHSISSTVGYNTQAVSYNLARKCTKLTGIVGMTDDSTPGDDYIFEVTGYGNALANHDLLFGTDTPISLNVGSILRLQIDWQDGTQTNYDQNDTVVFGNARVLCRF